ncbi:MAG TPA: DUF3089 domain-containing protein, partial [Methanocorpusculum sp.]|nr:DUF3089 domain-containing protein [Methanocorpusculum sp.]
MHRHRQLIAAYGAIRSIFAPQCNLTADRNGRIPTNYANPNNWMFMDRNPVQTVDLFYIYPAVSREPADSVVPITDQMKNDAKDAYLIQGSVFAEYCNLFVPYYRPVVFDDASRITDHHAWMDMLRSSVAKTDIFTAVDYYFTHLNKGRPFILAGYAEGSALVMLVLEEYMKDHPEHYRNMVAAYPIGWGVTQDWLDAYPHLKFATGKTDTGVIVSWNTVTEDVSPSAIVLGRNTRVINPLSWTTDETYADRSLNRGSLVSTGSEKTVTSRISLCDAKTGIKAGLCDARIDAERGVLVSTACPDDVASTGSPEYSLYYENLRNNGYDRITAFLGNRPLIGRPMDYSRKENWMFQATEAKHQADLFYVYPTVDMENNRVITSIGQGIEHTADGKIAVRIETTSSAVKNVNRPAKAVKETAKAAFARSGAAFESYTNVFAPYYSQIPMDRAVDYTQHTGYIDFLRKTRARTDIFAALD